MILQKYNIRINYNTSLVGHGDAMLFIYAHPRMEYSEIYVDVEI